MSCQKRRGEVVIGASGTADRDLLSPLRRLFRPPERYLLVLRPAGAEAEERNLGRA
jgi:hypothetical protein